MPKPAKEPSPAVQELVAAAEKISEANIAKADEPRARMEAARDAARARRGKKLSEQLAEQQGTEVPAEVAPAPSRKPRKRLSEQLAEAQALKDSRVREEREPPQPDLTGIDIDSQYLDNAPEKIEDDEPTPDAAAKEPSKSDFPDYLLRAALDYGLEAGDYKSPEALERAIRRQHQQMQAMQAQQPAQRAQQQEQTFDPFDGNEDAFDDATKTAIKRVTEHFAKHTELLQQQLAESSRYVAQQREREVDAAFTALNEKYGGALGNGSLSSCTAEQQALRHKIFQKALREAADEGGSPLNFLDDIAAMKLGRNPTEVATNIAARDTKSKIDKRRSQVLMPSSHRDPGPVDPRDEGIGWGQKFINGRPATAQ